MMRVLFMPWSHGVGFGYVGRALTIAQDLRAKGVECAFGCDTAEGLVSRSGFPVILPKTSHRQAVVDMGDRRGDYIPLDNLDTVYGLARYYHASRIREHLELDLEVVDAFKPDAISIDMQPTASLAARIRGIPLLSVADSDFLRDTDNSWMPWLSGKEMDFMPYPSCLPAFNEVLASHSLAPIKHVSDLLWGDLTLVASLPELEQNQEPLIPRGPMEYVGPIFWDPPWSDVAEKLQNFGKTAKRRIYITLGHGGKVATEDFQKMLDGCANPEWAVFVSLGFRPPEQMPILPPNAMGGGFTGIAAPISWSDLVINHGGYATVMTGLMYGKPSIIMPYMSEQEANGILFVEKPGSGFVLRRTFTSQEAGKRFEYQFRYSGRSTDGSFTADEVRKGVEEIFSKPEFAARALDYSTKLRETMDGRKFEQLLGRITELKPVLGK